MRVFISINIPENVRWEIEKIQNRLPEFVGKKIEFDNLHLTLKFLGDITEDKLKRVKEQLREIKYEKFNSVIDSIGFFDNRKSKKYSLKIITWLHLNNCEVFQKKIDLKLKDLFLPEKRFMGHITIARVKNIKDKKIFIQELNKIKIPKIKFNIDSFYLMSSVLGKNGPKYSIIEKYYLI